MSASAAGLLALGGAAVTITVVLLLVALAMAIWSIVSSRRATEALRRAEEALERAQPRIDELEDERRLRDLILSSMEEGTLLASRHGEITFANPTAGRHLGRLPEGAATLPPALLAAIHRARESGAPVSVETDLGSPRRTLRGLASTVGSDGSVLLVLRDVTEAKRLDTVRRDFVTNASHELKTPAAAIQAVAETIRRAARNDPDVVPRFAEQLEREAIRLSRIVSDLLDLSRLESGSDLASDVRIDDIAREETARYRPTAESAGLTLELDVGPTEKVRGSAGDLSLLVRNLIDNAIRWTRQGGSVRVRVDSVDGEARLEVADTGIGIPSRDLSRIFERFYRVDRARSRDTGGTGLGLSIVRHVAENHGGSVQVESELGRGTTFEVRLPAVHATRSPIREDGPNAEPNAEPNMEPDPEAADPRAASTEDPVR